MLSHYLDRKASSASMRNKLRSGQGPSHIACSAGFMPASDVSTFSTARPTRDRPPLRVRVEWNLPKLEHSYDVSVWQEAGRFVGLKKKWKVVLLLASPVLIAGAVFASIKISQ